jgi:hypothetical protein
MLEMENKMNPRCLLSCPFAHRFPVHGDQREVEVWDETYGHHLPSRSNLYIKKDQ